MSDIFATARIARVKGLSRSEMREYVIDEMDAQAERERAFPTPVTKGNEHGRETDDGGKF